VRACECVEVDRRLTGVCGYLVVVFGGFMLRGAGRYEGEWRDDKKHGRGIFTWSDGNTYEGDWVVDKRHGRGIYTWANKDR
jgi:hypothetical protein